VSQTVVKGGTHGTLTMALKATELPITAHVIAMLSPQTKNAALTGILFLLSFRKYLLKGSTPSRLIANVTRWADMKHEAAAHVESIQRMLRIATAPLAPMVWTRYSAQLLEYVALMMPSKSWMQNRMMMSVGTESTQAVRVLIHIPLATTTEASCVSSARCALAS